MIRIRTYVRNIFGQYNLVGPYDIGLHMPVSINRSRTSLYFEFPLGLEEEVVLKQMNHVIPPLTVSLISTVTERLQGGSAMT
jgi:hypothetical protein